MPIYKYVCESCGYKFEELQKVSDSPIEGCPECGKAVHKAITHSSFILKGSGWYATDYASKPSRLNNVHDEAGTKAKKKQTKKDVKSSVKSDAKNDSERAA